ncbi:hypothetical protein LOZ58_001040 [Ophidiomyces ophidiicola]|nr:hypothetical protein LOZ58_001040 [Ophidiomyces ophidiicola]
MGIPGLIQELGSGDRVSLAKFAIDHLQKTSRSIRIAIDVSIWLVQSRAAQGGSNPELRALFYRLTRLLALPIHPIFVFDGPRRPEYKRGKIVIRDGRAGGHLRSAKRLIELFGFHCHNAPGEAEAECAKLQANGIVDAAMSNDIDAIMFGSKVTLMNFSRASSKNPGAATHVNVYTREGTSANVNFDVGGMVLFALLSGGDYLPTGVPKCGPKLAAEIMQAGFGIDLINAAKGSSGYPTASLDEWRERLNYELSTNESGYFRCKHKAVQIPEDFPDQQALFDYVHPVTSPLSELQDLRNLPWDREIDVVALREFVSEEFKWTCLPGAHRFIRKFSPSLISYYLRAHPKKLPSAQVCGRKENINVDGLVELKLKYIPAHVVCFDLDAEEMPVSQAESLDSVTIVDESEPEDGTAEPSSSAAKRTSYDPTKEQIFWTLEVLATMGIPEAVRTWYEEQEQKKIAVTKPPGSKKGSRKTRKAVDSGMIPGSLHRYGTIMKAQPKSSAKSPRDPNQLLDSNISHHSQAIRNSTQKTIADCSAFAIKSTKSGASSFYKLPNARKENGGPTSSDIEAAMALGDDADDSSNELHRLTRIRIDSVEYITISSSPPEANPSCIEDRRSSSSSSLKTTRPAPLSPRSTSRSVPQSLNHGSNQNSSITKAASRQKHEANLDGGQHIIVLDDLSSDEEPSVISQPDKSLTQPTKTIPPQPKPQHIDLTHIIIRDGFWSYRPHIPARSISISNESDDPPSKRLFKLTGRASILDLTG